MKRYLHAWIAIRAIDRLNSFADRLAGEDEEIGESVKYYCDLLKSKIQLVVEGAWLPDNVIKDNGLGGHTWKYEPRLNESDKTLLHHEETTSLCYQEAANTYAWNKKWKKIQGRLVYRCIAIQQMMRDMILYQKDEMQRIAATLIIRFAGELYSDEDTVRVFLGDVSAIKSFYDKEVNNVFVNRTKVIDYYNSIGIKKEKAQAIKDCLSVYGDDIKLYLEHENARQIEGGKNLIFPLFYNDDQIALTFFTLAHYIADAHMPLHCDSRDFSSTACGNIHGRVEEEWENWVIESGKASKLTRSLSESGRAKDFINLVFAGNECVWSNYNYPNGSILDELDSNFGENLWKDRKIRRYEGDLWDDFIGITYASYCLSSSLIRFDDEKRVVPNGSKEKYTKNMSDENVIEIKNDDWVSRDVSTNIGRGLKSTSSIQRELSEIREGIFSWVKQKNNPVFKYLSLIMLVDSVEAIARVWAETIIEHQKIAYSKRKKS